MPDAALRARVRAARPPIVLRSRISRALRRCSQRKASPRSPWRSSSSGSVRKGTSRPDASRIFRPARAHAASNRRRSSGKSRCAFARSATAVAAREPRTRDFDAAAVDRHDSTRKRSSLRLRLVAAAAGLAQRGAAEPHDGARGDAILRRRALKRYPLAHARDDVRDVLDRACERRGSASYCASVLGPGALTAAAALWYLSHSSTQEGAETVAGLGP